MTTWKKDMGAGFLPLFIGRLIVAYGLIKVPAVNRTDSQNARQQRLRIPIRSIEQIVSTLEKHHYITDRPLATVLFLAQALKKPVFLEGEPGVGKTEVALVLSRVDHLLPAHNLNALAWDREYGRGVGGLKDSCWTASRSEK
jgi:hypothetical protein